MLSLSKKFTSLLVMGLMGLSLMVYLVSFSQPSSGQEKGLKLIHKDRHTPEGMHYVEVAEIPAAPPTTPGARTALAEHVKSTCNKLPAGKEANAGSAVNHDRYDHILVDDRYKMLYCYIPKVACTNWRRIMLVLSGKVKVRNVLDIPGGEVHGKYKPLLPRLSDYSPEETRYRLDNYFKFMFVREPFERLLSAFRNKFLSNNNAYFRKQFGQNILRRFRESSDMKAEGKRKAVVHFEEFLKYIVDPLRTETLNEHWAMYHKLCLPCSVQYDFVGKYETLDEDAEYVLKSVHVDHVVRFPKRSATYKHNETSTFLAGFYSNISVPLLRQVYRIYKKDFELFDYGLPAELQWMFRDEGEDRK